MLALTEYSANSPENLAFPRLSASPAPGVERLDQSGLDLAPAALRASPAAGVERLDQSGLDLAPAALRALPAPGVERLDQSGLDLAPAALRAAPTAGVKRSFRRTGRSLSRFETLDSREFTNYLGGSRLL